MHLTASDFPSLPAESHRSLVFKTSLQMNAGKCPHFVAHAASRWVTHIALTSRPACQVQQLQQGGYFPSGKITNGHSLAKPCRRWVCCLWAEDSKSQHPCPKGTNSFHIVNPWGTNEKRICRSFLYQYKNTSLREENLLYVALLCAVTVSILLPLVGT